MVNNQEQAKPSSGCPSAEVLTKQFINDYELGESLNSDKDGIHDVVQKLGDADFNSGLKKYFQNCDPSRGYWFLSHLLNKGYFDLIFTTNFDLCLEKILGKTIECEEFRTYVRGDINDNRINELILSDSPRIKIIKVHGDYQSRNAIVKSIDFWDLESSLKETIHDLIKTRGIIIIGYSMHDSYILNT